MTVSRYGWRRPDFILKAIVCIAISLSATAVAHHSGAMFDQSKEVMLEGTVKEFQWTNPHAWIQLMVPDEKGVLQEWSIELAGPPALFREGWRPSSLKAGDKITVVMNPMRDGSNGGNLVSVQGPDGKPIGQKRKS